MPETAATEAGGRCCAHCGLPLPPWAGTAGQETYCCNACRLVARIVGRQRSGELSWNVLRLALGSILAMNVMMISLLLYTGEAEPATVPAFRMTLLVLSAAALAILQYPFIAGAWNEIRRARVNMDSLIAAGSMTAFSVSAVNTIRGTGHIYFDTATMLPVLVTFGKIIESGAKSRSADLLRALERLLPTSALKMDGDRLIEVPTGCLSVGDMVRVRPGDPVPVDGIVVDGTSIIEESAFTGESEPRPCHPASRVIAGTVNGPGALLVRVTATGKDTVLGTVVATTDRALRTPAPSERLAERIATFFVPVVFGVAVLAAFFWISAGDPARGWLSALAVLVVACPCTMGIATPLATSVAIARAAQAGVVVRGGDVMERAGATDLVVFDKTGTLTDTVPRLHDIQLTDSSTTEEELLGRAAAVEAASEHIAAKVILEASGARSIGPGMATGIAVTPGRGISGIVTWNGTSEEVSVGTASFAGYGPALASDGEILSELWVSWGKRARGRVRWGAPLRPEAAETVAALKRNGMSTILLSGDNRTAAEAVGLRTGIDRVVAPCLPEEKLSFITTAIEAGHTVMMAGDGINDAPALAAASVGVAVGGVELVRQAGDVVLLAPDLSKIPWLIRLSRRSREIIRQNFAWSIAYNGLAIAAAAGGFLHPLLAAVAMVVSSLTVLSNSLRLRKFAVERTAEALAIPGVPSSPLSPPRD